MLHYGEEYLQEKLDIVKDYQRRGKIQTSPATLLVNAVKHDYKNGALALEEKKKKVREQKRVAKEEEIADSEKAMEQQRKERQKARDAVNSFLASTDTADLEQLEAQLLLAGHRAAEQPEQPQ